MVVGNRAGVGYFTNMTAADVSDRLAVNLRAVENRIRAACERAGRDRAGVTLVAVTKSVGPEIAALLPAMGVSDLGESRPQVLWAKAPALPRSVRWHLIGHLQRNKIDRTLPLVELVHSVDSERLIDALQAEAAKTDGRVRVLLEVNVSGEASKGGFSPGSLQQLTDRDRMDIAGLMTMAPLIEPEQCRAVFASLRHLRDQLQHRWGRSLPELSMGMSNDFDVAIEEGATLVRVGSLLFEGLPRTNRA